MAESGITLALHPKIEAGDPLLSQSVSQTMRYEVTISNEGARIAVNQLPIVPELRLPADLPVRFVFPHAPEMAVTAFGGQRARAWFDFGVGGDTDLPGLKKSVSQLHDLIQNEIGLLHARS